MIARLPLALLFCAVAAAAGWTQDSRTGNGCASCHAPEQAQQRVSVHGRGGASCVDCHGGNAAASTEKEAHSGNYLGKIERAAVPRLCAECHSDVRRMTSFGLSTDQFKAYSISRHGTAVLSRKNEAAAVCTDCHGVHDVVHAADPAGRLSPARQPETCGRCHAREDLMTPAHLTASVGKEFTAGLHGRAVAAGNAKAPTCTTCHGSHGAMAPGVSSVADVCGRCHEAEKESFRASPHGARDGRNAKVRCVDCHRPHGAETVGNGDVVTACAQCHKSDARETAAGKQMHETLQRVEAVAARTLADLDRASEDRSVAEQASRLREEAVPGLVRARATAHSLDLEGMRRITERLVVIESEARRLAGEQDETLGGRRLFAVPVAILSAAVAAGLLMLRQILRAVRKRRAGSTGATG